MADKQALQALFAAAYDRDRWLKQLHDIFAGRLEEFAAPHALPAKEGEDAPPRHYLGNLTTADGKKLGIFEIPVGTNIRLARNRVQLRNLVARQVQEHTLNGALAVYPDADNRWRFSYIAVTGKLDEKGAITKEETAHKRYTYLLGEGMQTRTAVDRFVALPTPPILEQLDYAFATEPLNKVFYQELYHWYERAKLHVVFPNDEREEEDTHVSTSLIRLLTRLLFIWFMKEKELINQDFFVLDKVRHMIDWNRESSYYKAILQNLFFATLNREIPKRRFRTTNAKGKPTGNNYLVTNVYRYERYFKGMKKAEIIKLFAQTPFLNGGLFECLDRDADEEKQRVYEKDRTIRKERKEKRAIRMDGFSDHDKNRLRVPNDLFFNDDEEQPGLINLLSRYQFTVEESMPLDADVALDPELLGLVFENLLASYNPETEQTARKASGSYYTPREIVSYMVDESLKAYFAQATDVADTKINRLFLPPQAGKDSTTGAASELTENETTALIQAIDTIKIIDPAVGSGAFPMGILQRLVQILGIVDPENKRWKKRQTDIIDKLPDTESREQARKEVETIFSEKNRFNDFGRKLYLIEKCIHGVDIQPIACQIAKLRFFISLTIEQKPTDDPHDNRGIKPLPNLETRFVAADTLLGLDRPAQRTLGQTDAVNRLERELNANRERHFRITTRKSKMACWKKDKELRNQLATELKQAGFPATNADKIARWDPYDQNASAAWFDPAWMFGVKGGFDVVIGNPPYVESRNSLLPNELKNSYGKQVLSDWKETLPRGSDLLIYFYARSSKLLKRDSSYGCFITQNAWLSTDYGKKFQKFSIGKLSFQKIVDTSSKFFLDTKSQNINAVITFFTTKPLQTIEYGVADSNMTVASMKNIKAKQTMKWGHLFSMPQFFADILSKMSANAGTSNTIKFGQGLNFPLQELNKVGAKIPIIVKTSWFVAKSADGLILQANRKKEKIPALILPRGVGNRHYCTFNLCRAFSYSHVELYLPDDLRNSAKHYCLWLYLNSSFVWLYREITGRKNLGGGLLKAEATDMKALPVDFDFDFGKDAKKVFNSIRDRTPMPVLEEIHTKDHILIDEIVANYFGFTDMQGTIRETLSEQVNFRLNRVRPQH